MDQMEDVFMKLMVASDIHGSAYYCKKMIDAYHREGADKILLLGDLLYHGPRNNIPEGYDPKEVSAQLNAVKGEILCVRGNCDSEVDQMMLDFPIMAEYCILYLGNRMIFATHGHHFNEEIPPKLKKGDILLNGHFHVPKCMEHEDFVYMNPGSVSIPKEDSPRGYMIIDEQSFDWKSLDGECFLNFKY